MVNNKNSEVKGFKEHVKGMEFSDVKDIIEDINNIMLEMNVNKEGVLLIEELNEGKFENLIAFLKIISDEQIVDTTTLLNLINSLYEIQGERIDKFDHVVLNIEAAKADFKRPFKKAIMSYYKKQKGVNKVKDKLSEILGYIIKSSDFYTKEKQNSKSLKKYIKVMSEHLAPKFYKSSMSLKTFLEAFDKLPTLINGSEFKWENQDENYRKAVYALKHGELDSDNTFNKLFTELEVQTANTDKLGDMYKYLSDSYIFTVRTLSDHLHNNFEKYKKDYEDVSSERHEIIMGHVNKLMDELYESKGNHKMPDVVRNAKSIAELYDIIIQIPLDNNMYEQYIAAMIKFSVYILGFGIHTEEQLKGLREKAKKFEDQSSNIYIKIPKEYYHLFDLDGSTEYDYLIANKQLLGDKNEYSDLSEKEKFEKLIKKLIELI
jgi:hypothetical protein